MVLLSGQGTPDRKVACEIAGPSGRADWFRIRLLAGADQGQLVTVHRERLECQRGRGK